MFPELTLIFLLSLTVIHPFHVSAKTWCVANPSAASTQLQTNIDWLCSQGNPGCVLIGPGGACFEPNNVINHASFVMNDYYQLQGSTEEACNFSGSGRIIDTNPSYARCVYS
ncbi:unnamed protein product [Arabidopsis thaliana]|uniref:X8 domain-containing protein n=1 Tax=Arabidopsis thaliana TaxID=3702 RepID=A0A654FPV7_ARATH|nr:unnamed protein product [Arabidopsis thaliana]VYS62881.1 unnamed protein product [Arabidopsis thaliana]